MRILSIALLLAATSASLSAQEPIRHQRRGFWLGLGLGPGSMAAQCATCSTDRINGAAGYLRLGGTLSQRFLLGVDLSGWAITVNGVDQTLSAATLSLFWYPSRNGGWYLKGGLGGAQYVRQSLATQTIETAGALTFGTGYELRIFRNVSIVPFLNVMTSGPVTRRVNGAVANPVDEFSRDMVQAGIGLTLH